MAARVPEEIREEDLEVHIVPMRRRHLRSVLRIESQVYPRPWSLSLFMSELAHARALREEFVPTWELEPLYLRKADAEINWGRRDAYTGSV